jgi:cytochrome c oxidase subunit 4
MSAHVVPVGRYVAVFAALMALTAATVAVAFFDLGPLNTVVAMAIAAGKAVLVGLVFMHLRWSGRLARVFAVAAIAWFALLLGLVFADVDTREWLPILHR